MTLARLSVNLVYGGVIVRQSFSGTGFTDVARRLRNMRELDTSDVLADNIAVTMAAKEREGRKKEERSLRLN